MSVADSVSRQRFAEMDVAVVSAGTLSGWSPYFAPDQDWVRPVDDIAGDGSATGGINWMLIRMPDAVVVVDPATFVPGQVIGRAQLTAGPPIEAVLAELAVAPADVTHVVISHFHSDHVCGLVAEGTARPRFPNATHLVPARDWRRYVVDNEAGDAAELMEQLGPPQRAGLVRQVEGDDVVTDGVRVLDTPGESAGHLCVHAGTRANSVYYLADLVHFPAEFEHIDWLAVRDRPADQLIASRRRVFSTADPEATYVFSHSRFPAWGRLDPIAPDSWRWSYL